MQKFAAHFKDKLPTDPPYDVAAEEFPEGIKVLYEPNGTVAADVVFIHGLTGDRERTWTHPKAEGPWPKLLLPQCLPDMRVLTFGYDAYIFRPRKAVSNNRISDHSADLLNALIEYRTAANSLARPIVFVVHSLGGILCKDAFLKSKNPFESRLRDLYESTNAIAFLGVPHSGSSLADLAKLPAAWLGRLTKANTKLLSVLRTESEILSRIHEEFVFALLGLRDIGRDVQVTCFYEALPTSPGGTIVRRGSATLPGYPAQSIHGDHRDIARFQSLDSPGFVKIVGELTKWREAIRQTRKTEQPSKETQANIEAKQRCRESLAFDDMGFRESNIDHTTAGTCAWIFDTPAYMQWNYNANDANASRAPLYLIFLQRKRFRD